MSLEVSIDGAATLHRVAAQMRAQGNKDLSKGMSAALSRATNPVRASIDAEASAVMPSGYRDLLTGSLRHRTSRRASNNRAQVVLTTYADGTKERREIKALERGILRHPVFGRSRRVKSGNRAGTILPNPWAVTSIRPGFHERGTENAADAARDAMIQVVREYAAKLIS
jgi:hypothetical protein